MTSSDVSGGRAHSAVSISRSTTSAPSGAGGAAGFASSRTAPGERGAALGTVRGDVSVQAADVSEKIEKKKPLETYGMEDRSSTS